MAKFKIGDKVISITPVGRNKVTGATGKIVDILGDDLPYLVKFDQDIGERHICASQGGWWCHEDDIELVKENNMFTKKDLKNGDMVLRRNGNVDVVILDIGCLLNNEHGGFCLSNIDDDLTSVVNEDWDIIAVRRPKKAGDCTFDAFKFNYGELVYERKEVEEMTLEEVCKALGKEIKIVKK